MRKGPPAAFGSAAAGCLRAPPPDPESVTPSGATPLASDLAASPPAAESEEAPPSAAPLHPVSVQALAGLLLAGEGLDGSCGTPCAHGGYPRGLVVDD